MLDDITQAVLAREDVARYLRGGHGQSELEARERIHAYLDELRTTQRYPIYRALKHPLYPILRKIDRVGEHVEVVKNAVRGQRVVPLGIESFGQSGDIPDLYRSYKLDAAAIVDAVARSI